MTTNSTVYTDYNSAVPVRAAWLNDVNNFVYAISLPSGVTQNQYLSLLGLGGVVSSIAALRAQPKTGSPNYFVTGYYTQGDGGGGSYYLVPSDTTSADNGGTIIVASDGGRWYLNYTDFVTVKQFGAKGDGSTIDTPAFNTALANVSQVRVPATSASYLQNSYILVPAHTTLFGEGETSQLLASQNMPSYSPWGAAHQGQMVLLNGAGASVQGLWINGGNFTSGGVGTWTFDSNRIERCKITNCSVNSQGTLHTGSTHLIVADNNIQYASDGIEIWQVTSGNFTGNVIDVVNAGGIFVTDSTNISISGNTVSNCGDVGIDMEGGVNCSAVGNSVTACNNGELSWFANGTGSGRVPVACLFAGNSVYRVATYLAGTSRTVTACNSSAGGIMVNSSTASQISIAFIGNQICAIGMPGLWIDDQGTISTDILVKDNYIESDTLLHSVNRAYTSKINNNVFRGLSGAQNNGNMYKNCNLGEWIGNTYIYDIAPTTAWALHYYTDAVIANGPTIANNVFKNCGDNAFQHDPYGSGNIPAILYGNDLTDNFTANGGITCTVNGYPLYRGQKVLIGIANGTTTPSLTLGSVSALMGAGVVGRGNVQVWGGTTLGSSYDVVYVHGAVGSGLALLTSRDGSGSGSGIGASTQVYVTFSGSTISVNSSVGTAAGYLEMDLVSHQ